MYVQIFLKLYDEKCNKQKYNPARTKGRQNADASQAGRRGQKQGHQTGQKDQGYFQSDYFQKAILGE